MLAIKYLRFTTRIFEHPPSPFLPAVSIKLFFKCSWLQSLGDLHNFYQFYPNFEEIGNTSNAIDDMALELGIIVFVVILSIG